MSSDADEAVRYDGMGEKTPAQLSSVCQLRSGTSPLPLLACIPLYVIGCEPGMSISGALFSIRGGSDYASVQPTARWSRDQTGPGPRRFRRPRAMLRALGSVHRARRTPRAATTQRCSMWPPARGPAKPREPGRGSVAGSRRLGVRVDPGSPVCNERNQAASRLPSHSPAGSMTSPEPEPGSRWCGGPRGRGGPGPPRGGGSCRRSAG